MLAGIAHNVHSCQEGDRGEDCVRTIEQRHLALVVGRLIMGEDDMQTSLIGRELACQLFDRQIGSGLNHPEVESLSLNDHLVGIPYFLLDGIDVLAGEARDDAIHQRSADITRLLKPLAERLEVCPEVFLPQLDILADAIHKVMTVLEDEFARHDDKSFGRVAVESTEAVVEQLRELAGIRGRRRIVQPTSGVEGNTGLGGVGDDKAHIGLRGQCQESSMVDIGIHRAADAVNEFKGVHGLTVDETL